MAFLAAPRPRARVPTLEVGTRALSFGHRTHIMGVVNVTPDSFSDGGAFFDAGAAIEHGLALAEAGATILDIGGESTRPGATPVGLDEELRRVVPVIEGLAQRCDAWLSVDTYKAEVARQAITAGAHIINDISAMTFDQTMIDVIATHDVGIVLMHTRARPDIMQDAIIQGDIVREVVDYLGASRDVAIAAGISATKIMLDPGIGFGKSVTQNYQLIRELGQLRELGSAIVLGTSRKSLIGAVTGRPANERLMGTAATIACGIFAGADIVRVHDVAELIDVVRVSEAICALPPPEP